MVREKQDLSKRQRNLRLPVALDDQLEDFCSRTTRTPNDVIRFALQRLFADGLTSADELMSAALRATAQPTGVRHDRSAAEHAADLMPLESDRKREPRAGKRGA
jgi:hypothetical protein